MDEMPLHTTTERASTGVASLSFLLGACVIAAAVFFCVSRNMADSDIWWHLRDAQLQLANHRFLTHDTFSYTAAGSPWMNHEWLGELPLYAGYHFLGARGLYLVTLFSIEVIFLGVLWLAWLRSGSVPAATFATFLGVLLSTVSYGPRTLLFGWLLLVAELLLLFYTRRREKLAWALPVVFLLWVNTHGSWMIGLVLFALYIAASCVPLTAGLIHNERLSPTQLRRLSLCWLASAAALFVNPYGWRLVFYPFDMAFRQKLNIANVQEWMSLDFHTPRGRIMMLLLALFFVFQLLRPRRWELFELALLAVGLYSAFSYSRFLFLAAILAGPLLARSMARPAASDAEGHRAISPVMSFGAIFLLLCLCVGKLRTEPSATTENKAFPDRALPYLAGFHPQGNVLNEFTWGGYLVWHKRDLPVFIDSRVDIFEYNGTFADYLDITHLKDPLALLDSHHIRYVFFKTDSPLVYLLKKTYAWKVDYEDPDATMLERINP